MTRIQLPIAAFSLLLLLAVSGCGGTKPTDTSEASSATGGESDADRCEKKLASALGRLQPESMAMQARRDGVVNALNSWLTTCASEAGKSIRLSEANAALLSPSVQRFATAARFTENDTAYIRDCIILRGMTASVWQQADTDAAAGIASDRQRVVRLFSDVAGSVVIMPPDEQRIPVGLYEVLLTGRGSHEDRIWVFTEALRQRQIDAFLIRPSSAPKDDLSGSLIAVALETEVLLFNPLTGAPVPKPNDNAILVTEPATLADLQAQEQWQKPSVVLMSQPASFAPRMLLLQEQLPGESSITLYEELAGGGSEIRPLVERVVSAGGGAWDQQSISIWSYAETRIAASGALTEEQQQAYQLLLKPYDAPFERDPLKSGELLDDPGKNPEEMSEEQKMERRMQMLQERYNRIMQSSDELFGRPSKRFLKVRIEQITGNNDISMIQQLQQVRIATMQDAIEVSVPVGDSKEAVVMFPLPEAIREIHRSATGDALYWTARCQALRRDDGAAVTTFRNYRKQYPEGKFYYPSMTNEAISLIRLGDLDSARAVLTESSVDPNPERAQSDWLLSRLPAADPNAPTDPKPAAEAPPADAAANRDAAPGDAALNPEPAPKSDAPPTSRSDGETDPKPQADPPTEKPTAENSPNTDSPKADSPDADSEGKTKPADESSR